MNTTINTLLSRMNEDLQQVALTAENPLQRAEQSYHIVQAAMQELKEFALGYTFTDKEQEIHFFKEVKPLFLKELIYYAELFDIESNRPVGSKEIVREYYLLSLNRIHVFFERHQWLYLYHRTGKTNFDDMFYTRDHQPDATVPHLMPEIDTRFSTLYSFKLSKIMAFESLTSYLTRSIQLMDEPATMAEDNSAKKHSMVWTDPKAALIELAYAIHSRGSVNNGRADVKHVITSLEHAFNISLGNYSAVFQQNIRIRKRNSRTSYLDQLREYLNRRMDDADEYPGYV
jgi:hypothetical protein